MDEGPHTRRVGLFGWNGRLNVGDDAMSMMIAQSVADADPAAQIRCYGDRAWLPDGLRRMGVVGNPLFNLSIRLPGLRPLLRRHVHDPGFLTRAGLDLLIVGGGSILREQGTIGHIQRLIGRLKERNPSAKVLGFGLSVGPFTDDAAGEAARALLPAFDRISVRETRSEELVRTLCPDADLHRHPDPAFAWFRASRPQMVPSARADGKRTLCVILRAGERETEQVAMLDWLARLDPSRYRLSFAAFCAFRTGDDAAFARRQAGRFAAFEHQIVAYRGDLDATARVIAAADAVVSVRLHGMIHALCLDKPVLYFAYHAKLDDIAGDAGLPDTCRITPDTLTRDPATVLEDLPSVDSARIEALAAGAGSASRHVTACLGAV